MTHILVCVLLAILVTACSAAKQDAVTSSPAPYPLLPTYSFNYTPISPHNVSATPLATYFPGYDRVKLNCSTYLETAWGDGPRQWGSQTKEYGVPLMFSFNGEARFYYADYPNRRLLYYDEIDPNFIQTINLPDKYFEKDGFFWPEPRMVFATAQRIFVPHAFDKLGILSVEGIEEKEIQLPYSFSFLSDIWNNILEDDRGGLFVNSKRLAYFGPGWENGEWHEISSIVHPARLTPFVWNGYFVNQDTMGAYPDLHLVIELRKIDPSTDFLSSPPDYVDPGIGLPYSAIG